MIKTATLSQLSQIMGIYAQARQFMAQTGNPDQWGTVHPSEELIRQDILNGRCYVNLDGDHIRAVFYFAVEKDPTYSYIEGQWLNDMPYGVIHRIAVGQSGKGVAAECFAFAAAHCDNIRIDTHEKNVPMQRCLAKNGFSRCGIIYLENGDPRIAYQKVITNG